MIPKKDLRIDRIRGSGPGGQNKNKVNSCIRLTHLPTKTVVTIDGRDQGQNLKQAMRELEHRLAQMKRDAAAAVKKQRRDVAIKDETTVRTYDYSRGVVTDHRSGKKASIKNILVKARLEMLRPDPVALD